jgi:hypothetical protein
MTQPAPTTPAPAETEEGDPLTMKDLMDEIAERAGVDILEQAIGDHAVWYPPPGRPDHPTVLAVGQPMSMRPSRVLYFLFQDADEYRAYAGPGATPEPGSDPEKLCCYTFSKRGPVYFVDLLPAEAFVQLVADEWVVKAEGSTTAERERERVVAHLGALVAELEQGTPSHDQTIAARALRGALTDIENEDHLDEGEEPETEPETPAPPDPAAATLAPPAS